MKIGVQGLPPPKKKKKDSDEYSRSCSCDNKGLHSVSRDKPELNQSSSWKPWEIPPKKTYTYTTNGQHH